MGQLVFSTGMVTGGFYLLAQAWSVIEQPALELLLLGRVPGTDYVVGFNQALTLLLLFLLIAIYRQHRRYLQRIRLRLILLRAL